MIPTRSIASTAEQVYEVIGSLSSTHIPDTRQANEKIFEENDA